MYSFEIQYREALNTIWRLGELRSNRTDTPARSMFDIGFRVLVNKYYPILNGKSMDINIVNTEFEWFINGHTNTKLFNERGIKIWDAWADDKGNLGPVYGYQLINFNGDPACNQLQAVIKSIIETPFHRRHVISLWNPQQLKEMALPPCYLYFQFYVEGNKLNMFVVQRSGDMFAGVPFDICLFTNLLVWVAVRTNLMPNIISHRIVDAHIYENHKDGLYEYMNRSMSLKALPIYSVDLFGNITLHNYDPYPRIKIPIAK